MGQKSSESQWKLNFITLTRYTDEIPMKDTSRHEEERIKQQNKTKQKQRNALLEVD